MKKEIPYFDVEPTIEKYPEAKYYLFVGERSNGKTFSSLNRGVKKYYNENGSQFAYIRRWGEDVRKKKMTELFSGHIEKGFIKKDTEGCADTITFENGKFYLGRTNEGEVEWSDDPCGYVFDLNSMEHFKSLSFPRIKTIIFDEFIARNGYLPNEWQLFTNTLSTIIRERDDVEIIMLGNTVNKYSIYFEEMGIKHIGEQKEGTIDVYKYNKLMGNRTVQLEVVVEMTPSTSKKGGKPSEVYFAFDNPQLQMITDGSWEISLYPHLNVKLRPMDIITNFFVEFNREILHGQICIVDDVGYFVFIHLKTTPLKNENEDIIYTTYSDERWNYKTCLTKQSDKLSIFIMTCLRENKIFYSTNEVGEIFRNYIMWSDSYSIKN